MALAIAIAALLALWLLREREGMTRAAALPAMLACVVAGLTLPDIDQPLSLDHRSAATHSILPAVAALARRWARPVAAGLALGVGLHLSADFFPNAMIGYATVKMPLLGSLGANGSYGWLLANALACGWLGGRLLRTEFAHPHVRGIALVGTALIGIAYLLSVDGGWPALALLLAAAWLARRVPRRSERLAA